MVDQSREAVVQPIVAARAWMHRVSDRAFGEFTDDEAEDSD